MKRRLLRIITCLVLCLSLLPAAAMAEEEGSPYCETSVRYREELSQHMVSCDEPAANPFADVAEDASYYDAVCWALSEGVTSGTTDTTFTPDAVCTRAQMAVFLWRAAGSPASENAENPFADVPADAWYAEAVRWGYEKGVIGGTTATTFSPDAACTRAQAAAFIYRSEQANGGGFTGMWMFRIPFTDMPEWAFEAVAWCYMKGITPGTTDSTFGSNDPCTRGEIVTFLHRFFVR